MSETAIVRTEVLGDPRFNTSGMTELGMAVLDALYVVENGQPKSITDEYQSEFQVLAFIERLDDLGFTIVPNGSQNGRTDS